MNLDGKTSPWELDEAYRRWKDSCGMAAAGVTWDFAIFVREMFQWAERVFQEYTADCTTLFPTQPPEWNTLTKNAEAKMLAYTYGSMPDELQTLFYNNKTNSGAFCLPRSGNTPPSLICIATILLHINPGGAQIKRDLAAYLRKPKIAETPAEALAEMARWQRAHSNSVYNG